MRGLMRLLIMFGPMLFRQFQKYQRKGQRNSGKLATPQDDYNRRSQQQQQQQPAARNNREYDSRHSNDQRRNNQPINDRQGNDQYEGRKRVNRSQQTPLKPEKSLEEKQFDLKDEEIMLDNNDLKHFDKNKKTDYTAKKKKIQPLIEKNSKSEPKFGDNNPLDEDQINKPKEDGGFKLRDLFLEKDE